MSVSSSELQKKQLMNKFYQISKKKNNTENKIKSTSRLYRTSIKLLLINCGILIDSHW